MASRNPQPDDQDETYAPSIGAGRIVDDRLPDSFAVEHSESEWLMTLLGPDELAYIFGDGGSGEAQD